MYDIVCVWLGLVLQAIVYVLIKRISFKHNMTEEVEPISIKYCLTIKVYYQIRQNNVLFTIQTDKKKEEKDQ